MGACSFYSDDGIIKYFDVVKQLLRRRVESEDCKRALRVELRECIYFFWPGRGVLTTDDQQIVS